MWKRLAYILATIACVAVLAACGGPKPAEVAQPSVVPAAPQAEKAPERELRVGAACAPVSPREGVYLAGYGQNRRCTGVHDDLYVKAVVFDDGVTPLALVVVDSIGIQYDTVQDIRKEASAATSAVYIPPDRIIVCSTHTHCSPDVIGIYGPDPTRTGRDPEYMTMLAHTAARQVAAAAERLQVARLVYAETTCTGWAVNDSEPGVVDSSVTVLQCEDKDGRPIATLTSFACHPTVLDGDTTQASADWVGAFYREMAAALPGEHLFLQGSVGGWIQPVTPERTFELADKYGRDLAEKTMEALQNTRPVTGAEIRFKSKVFDMPVQNEMFKQIAAAGLLPRPIADTVQTEVAWFSVGSAQFATHPGETAPAFSAATEALMDTGPKFVLGLGLDQLGYILKPSYFDDPVAVPHASYQITVSLGKDAGPAMMAALEAVIP